MKNKTLNHLAIIMDGNRRWAKARFMPAIFWHKAWFDNIKKVTRLAHEKWITHLTLWALSTENLKKRPADEIEWIIKIIGHVPKLIPEFMREEVRLEMIGDISKLPEDSQKILREAKEETSKNTWIILTVALVYWGQDEIIRATKKVISDWIDPEKLSAEEFRKYLDTSILPVPDVIVRTWWDVRHSGFLLYDSAYSEYYFTEKKWPEFDEEELNNVIETFHWAKRNFWS